LEFVQFANDPPASAKAVLGLDQKFGKYCHACFMGFGGVRD
jgi:hypothetical protein